MDFLGYITGKVFVCAQVRKLQLGLTAGYRGAAFEHFRISSTFKTIVFPCHVGLPTLTVTMNLSDSSLSTSRTSAPKAPKTFRSKGALEIQ